MRLSPLNTLFARMTSALLALALLAGPSLAQVAAAEQCRTRCDSAAAAPACCGGAKDASHDDARGQHHGDSEKPADTHQSSSERFCAGCGGRPLALDAPRLSLALDLAPLFVPATDLTASASFEEPFAIFHPPRV